MVLLVSYLVCREGAGDVGAGAVVSTTREAVLAAVRPPLIASGLTFRPISRVRTSSRQLSRTGPPSAALGGRKRRSGRTSDPAGESRSATGAGLRCTSLPTRSRTPERSLRLRLRQGGAQAQHRRDPVAATELGVGVLEVLGHRAPADPESACRGLRRQTAADQLQH